MQIETNLKCRSGDLEQQVDRMVSAEAAITIQKNKTKNEEGDIYTMKG